MKNYYQILFVLLAFCLPLNIVLASDVDFNPVYNDSTVAKVYIEIDADSLALIFHPDSVESDHEYPALFTFENHLIRETVENVGFRLRGNTSRFSQKKSFKVSFNAFERGRKFYGLEKLNLNGEHNDPSIIRSKLCWDLFEEMNIPASRANHVMVYINDDYYGLYINVEHVDENFVDLKFGNNDGNLYKCLWPADLVYLGEDPDLYKQEHSGRRAYELKINTDIDDYSDLINFIKIINLTSADSLRIKLEKVFNVNSFLQALAVDVATASWDDYWFLKNNYYLYHNAKTDKFEYIPYDYDNTFGIWWDGILPGVDWGDRNIYDWGNPNEPRPLVQSILEIPEYRNRFSYYLNKLLQTNFNQEILIPKIDKIHTLITPAAELDIYRTMDYGYTIDDFHNSYTQPLGGHVTYGLLPYIAARENSAYYQLILNNISPIITKINQTPSFPQLNENIHISCFVEDDDDYVSVHLAYFINGGEQERIQMFDDGNHFDGEVEDKIYGASIPALTQPGLIEYFIVASDASGNQSIEPLNAPDDVFRFYIGTPSVNLFVNEFMASNDTTIVDDFGEFDDWVEIYNGDTASVWLGDKFLSDDFDQPDKWQLPDSTLNPGDFILIWTDKDDEQGNCHTSYKLDKDGEEIGIFDSEINGFAPIDTISFGLQTTDVSYGRTVDGGSFWQYFYTPTPGFSNSTTMVQENKSPDVLTFKLKQNYPNPFNSETIIPFQLSEQANIRIEIFNIVGERVCILTSKKYQPGSWFVRWDGKDDFGKRVASGVYFMRMSQVNFSRESENGLFERKLVFIQ